MIQGVWSRSFNFFNEWMSVNKGVGVKVIYCNEAANANLELAIYLF